MTVLWDKGFQGKQGTYAFPSVNNGKVLMVLLIENENSEMLFS